MAKQKGTPVKRDKGSPKIEVVEYYVVPNGQRWDVERDDTFTGSFAYDKYTAIGLATTGAQRDQHNEREVMVCI